MPRLPGAPIARVCPPASAAPQARAGFPPPVKIHAAGRPVDVERSGHAAPFVGDFDGDGKLALLVGQYHEGRLRIYRNTGTRDKPKFETYTWFEAGGQAGPVPQGGCIRLTPHVVGLHG